MQLNWIWVMHIHRWRCNSIKRRNFSSYNLHTYFNIRSLHRGQARRSELIHTRADLLQNIFYIKTCMIYVPNRTDWVPDEEKFSFISWLMHSGLCRLNTAFNLTPQRIHMFPLEKRKRNKNFKIRTSFTCTFDAF